MSSHQIKGLLIDLDGTLIDSNDAHAKAWFQALQEAGIPVDFQSVRRRIGMGGDHLLPEVAKIHKESDLGKKIDQRRGEIFHSTYLPKLKAFPKASELLNEFKSQGLKLVIASSSSSKDLKSLLRQANLENVVDEQTSSSDSEHSKPNPDIIEAAMKKIGLGAEEVMMLGDTPYDLEAAKRAGVKTIAFTCGGWSREELGDADFIFADPKELLKTLRENPGAISI